MRCSRFGFQGQEEDDEVKGEGNSVNYTFRMHDPRLGRFFAVDPLFMKYPFYSPYAFSGNRVIDATELEGLEPYVLFESADAAAINFGQYFNDNSIRSHREYGATIYKITSEDTKKVMYAYTEPNIGKKDEGEVSSDTRSKIPEGGKEVARTHTHANYTKSEDNDFSGLGETIFANDIDNADRLKLDSYVTTPNGATQKYDVTNTTVQQISNSSPSDPNDPSNNKKPSNYENYIKIGGNEFNSDKAKKIGLNKFQVKDVRTNEKFNVNRNKDGSYDKTGGN